MKHFINIFFTISLFPLFIQSINAQWDIIETQKVNPQDNSFHRFGKQVAVEENYAVVTADGVNIQGNGSGAAYIFEKEDQEWVLKAEVVPSDGKEQFLFGSVLDMDKDRFIVGTGIGNSYDINKGYIFHRDTTSGQWYQEDTIKGADVGANYESLGVEVAIEGDFAAIAAKNKDGDGLPHSGVVYVFKRDGHDWNQIQKLTFPDQDTIYGFGNFVSMDGPYMAIGSYHGEDDIGQVNIYKLVDDKYVYFQALKGEDYNDFDFFGYYGKMHGDKLIVSTPHNYDDLEELYVFEIQDTLWKLSAKITEPDTTNRGLFGIEFDVYEDRILVSDRSWNTRQGVAYLYEKQDSSWILIKTILSSDGDEKDYFGNGVSIWKNQILIGASIKFVGDQNAVGAAYFFEDVNYADEDMDGFYENEDCDDNDPAINTDAQEIPNNDIDENCDGIIFIIDEDMDGFNSDEDCDDNDENINPNAEDTPNNGIDEDCDGMDAISSIDNTLNQSIKVYPNPSTGIINFESDIEILSIKISNSIGQVVQHESINDSKTQIDLINHNQGMYILEIIFNQNQSTYKKIFIK